MIENPQFLIYIYAREINEGDNDEKRYKKEIKAQ